jgi:hypothetical protein
MEIHGAHGITLWAAWWRRLIGPGVGGCEDGALKRRRYREKTRWRAEATPLREGTLAGPVSGVECGHLLTSQFSTIDFSAAFV